MITIIDYGMGNIGSIANMLKKIGEDSLITSDKNTILNATKLILPGVGSYAMAMQNLIQLELVDAINDCVKKGTPLLGICLGMQLLSSHSEEGDCSGLDIIPGNVKRFDIDSTLKVPHMGWNLIEFKKAPIFLDFDKLDEVRFYFVHSYYYECLNQEHSIATCNYGKSFTCSIQKDNVYGMQFHPEKSHKFGMKLLQNFCSI